MKIRNRLEQLQAREKITKYEKIIREEEHSNIIQTKKKKLYDYYKCDYCGDEIRLDIKQAERTGGIVEFPHILTKRGKVKLVLCNKCLTKALKEFEQEKE